MYFTAGALESSSGNGVLAWHWGCSSPGWPALKMEPLLFHTSARAPSVAAAICATVMCVASSVAWAREGLNGIDRRCNVRRSNLHRVPRNGPSPRSTRCLAAGSFVPAILYRSIIVIRPHRCAEPSAPGNASFLRVNGNGRCDVQMPGDRTISRWGEDFLAPQRTKFMRSPYGSTIPLACDARSNCRHTPLRLPHSLRVLASFWFRSRKEEGEIGEEVKFHIDMDIGRSVEKGMSLEAAKKRRSNASVMSSACDRMRLMLEVHSIRRNHA